MRYGKIEEGAFISRPNRFIAEVKTSRGVEIAHVKNTGRCRELLVPDSRVWLSVSDSPSRKTAYDLVAVEKITESGRPLLINMDSQAPNDVAEEWLRSGALLGEGAELRREVTKGDSRYDFKITKDGKEGYLEVKGVTLEENGVVMFPDAPTERGVKHIEGLIRLRSEGYGAYILFVVQMKGVKYFTPNVKTHPEFGDALKRAKEAGVEILCIDSVVTESGITYGDVVDVVL